MYIFRDVLIIQLIDLKVKNYVFNIPDIFLAGLF